MVATAKARGAGLSERQEHESHSRIAHDVVGLDKTRVADSVAEHPVEAEVHVGNQDAVMRHRDRQMLASRQTLQFAQRSTGAVRSTTTSLPHDNAHREQRNPA